jgi:phosphatidate cytidylyltransferase
MAVWREKLDLKPLPADGSGLSEHLLNLLKRILTAVLLIPITLLIVLRAPVPVVAAVAALVALLAADELLKIAEAYGIAPLEWGTLIFVGLFFLLLAISSGEARPLLSTAVFLYGIGFAVAIAPCVFLLLAMRRNDLARALPAALVSVFVFAYIAVPMAMLVQLRQQWSGAFLVLYLLLVVWAGDICAYFVGRSLGRNFMAPRISPRKTWEGALASLVASLIVGMLLYDYASPISSALLNAHLINRMGGIFSLEKPPLAPSLWLSGAINLAAQLGDLLESVIKRGAGVKDSGTILPGHGGMLDRVDALLLAAPVVWYYAAWRVIK